MIKKIIAYIEYKKKLRSLKMIAVNQLANFVVNKTDYIVGFENLLLTLGRTSDSLEMQRILNDYETLVKKTKIANDAMNK